MAVDYVNDSCDLRLKSRHADGVPDEVIHQIAERIAEFGYFDPAKVRRLTTGLEAIKEHLATDRASSFRLASHVIDRTVLGMAMNFVVTTQLLESQVRSGRFNGAAHDVAAAVPNGIYSAAQ